jgi:hypothetical protein
MIATQPVSELKNFFQKQEGITLYQKQRMIITMTLKVIIMV